MQKLKTVTSLRQAEIDELEKLYSFVRRDEVLNFIEGNYFLMPLLLEAPDKLKQYFPDAKLFLEVVTDPEIIGDVRLWINIVTELEPEESVDKLQVLYDNWWLDNWERGDEKIEVGLASK